MTSAKYIRFHETILSFGEPGSLHEKNVYVFLFFIASMYGIVTYIWLFLMVKYGFHVGKNTIVPWIVRDCYVM